jgi:hypothetical protein
MTDEFFKHIHPDAYGKINPKSLIGKIIEEKGYLSTSAKREIAEKFENGIMREIRVPPSAKCADISGISYFKNEYEYLFARNQKTNIIDAWYDKNGVLHTVEELVL